jgi:hypothetical protein
METVKDYVGNELHIGDNVVVLSSGNSSWRKGVVTGFTEIGLDIQKCKLNIMTIGIVT